MTRKRKAQKYGHPTEPNVTNVATHANQNLEALQIKSPSRNQDQIHVSTLILPSPQQRILPETYSQGNPHGTVPQNELCEICHKERFDAILRESDIKLCKECYTINQSQSQEDLNTLSNNNETEFPTNKTLETQASNTKNLHYNDSEDYKCDDCKKIVLNTVLLIRPEKTT